MDFVLHSALRIVKSIVFAAMMLFSLRTFGLSWGVSLAAMLIPALLIASNVFAGHVYAVTALLFIAAAGSGVVGEVLSKPEVATAATSATTAATATAATAASAVSPSSLKDTVTSVKDAFSIEKKNDKPEKASTVPAKK